MPPALLCCCAVSIERVGRCKPDLLLTILPLEELLAYHRVNMERKLAQMKALTLQTGTVMRLVKIFDLEGLGARHLNRAALAYLQAVLRMGQANYPEQMGHIYLVNVPALFKVVWAIVKPWINEQSLKKITICGGEWKQTLLNDIDAKHLPRYFGGTCECPGGCVPETDAEAGYTASPVAAGQKHSVETKVAAAGSIVSWEFRTRANDVGFEARFAPFAAGSEGKGSGPAIVLHENKKVNAHTALQTGTYEAKDGAGILTLTFDNSYSWRNGTHDHARPRTANTLTAPPV
jgi:hypothetical protein